MLNLEGENGQIIKIDTQKSFLDIREAFVFREKQPNGTTKDKVVGKIQLQFRCYDKNRPKGQKITQKVDFYLDTEDAAYLGEIMKTARIQQLCLQAMQNAAKKAQEDKKDPKAAARYAFGYVKYGGTASSKVSRQLKFQLGDDGRLWIKALEGPGIVESKGQIKPNYKDNEATNSIAMPLTEEQVRKIGLAIERALFYFDTWAANGIVVEKVAEFHTFKKDEEEQLADVPDSSGFYPDYMPDYENFSQDLPEQRF